MSETQPERYLTFFSVGNGNSALLSLSNDQNLLFDLNDTEEYFPVLDFLKTVLPKAGKRPFLSVYCVSHGDNDHVQGAERLLKDFDVGEIWYPNYDRFQMEDKEPPDDYRKLHEEIDRRRKAMQDGSRKAGDLAHALTAMDYVDTVCGALTKDFALRVLSPYIKDEGEEEFDINDMSLVPNVEVSGMRWLFAGDGGARIWLERINTHLLAKNDYRDWAKADNLIAAHHGSHTFFDKDREAARDNPSNYVSLKEKILPNRILVSSNAHFPMKDEPQQLPPHYAAYKWYKQYLVDKKLCKEGEEHPFLYTCDGSIRFELRDGKWEIVEGWEPDKGDDKGGGGTSKAAFTPVISVGEHAPRKFA
jgi:beta-lactamase superfamily II metal-dependent hydrolase